MSSVDGAAEKEIAQTISPSSVQEIDRVLSSEDVEVVDLALLNLDPNNARLHPERNMASIRLSLSRYGQMKPVVVRRSDMLVMAGNGTVQAARDLGWTRITVAFREVSDLDFQGYGLADNRTAELARWDLETVRMIGRLQAESEGCLPGWSTQEVLAMRLNLVDQLPEQDQTKELSKSWQVLVDCEDEEVQLEVLELLMEIGYVCRALTT